MVLSLTRDDDWRALLKFLPKRYEALAVEHDQLGRQWANAKITSADWLLRFILLHAGANLPLLQTVTLIAQAGGPRLSAMRLHMKMRGAAPYLKALVEQMTPWRAEAAPERWGGYVMTLVDATVVCGPGAVGTDARIHVKLRAADLAIWQAEVTNARGGETFKRFAFKAKELAVGDRAYCNAHNVVHVREHGADVLIRYNEPSLPLRLADGSKLDALALCRKLSDDEVLDLPVTFEHRDEVHGARFIAMRLPPAGADKARKRVHNEHGAKASPAMFETAGYVMLLTTVPAERLDATLCLQAYRLRWQIELQFKRWKSLCNFDRLPNYRDDTIVAWLYAKLLLGVLLDRMSADQPELSPPVRLEVIPRHVRRPRRPAAARTPALAHDKRPLPAGHRGTASSVPS